MSLPLTNDQGSVKVTTEPTDSTDRFNAGVAYRAGDGAMRITSVVLASDLIVGGQRRSLTGAVVVELIP